MWPACEPSLKAPWFNVCMSPQDLPPPAERDGTEGAALKRQYVAPKLETLGTIHDLTHGLGMKKDDDGGHPPGQNKSIGM
jgi:hypothetical protein